MGEVALRYGLSRCGNKGKEIDEEGNAVLLIVG